MRAVVVALGDLGRSARMRYHAQALAAHGVDGDAELISNGARQRRAFEPDQIDVDAVRRQPLLMSSASPSTASPRRCGGAPR